MASSEAEVPATVQALRIGARWGNEVDLRILGPVELLDGDARVKLGRAKERALLGVLALSCGRPVGIRVLQQALWDDQPPDQARKDLQIYVSRLRRYLRDAGASAQIITQHDTYCFIAGAESVDYQRFKTLLNAGRHAQREGRLDEAAEALYRGTALWNGPPIAELSTIWMEQRREELDNYDRVAGYQALCDVELERGNYRDVLQILDEVTDGHELDSKYIAQRLAALDGCGHYADFDAYWRQIYRRNIEAFGTGPPRELQEFHSQLLQARDHVLPGAHPAEPTWTRPAQLPSLVSGFLGRRDELTHLESLLTRSRMSGPIAPLLVVLTGAAGVGKTELALQWAHTIKNQFPDGHLYSDLGGFSPAVPADPGAIIGDFLSALGTPPGLVPDTLSARSALLRTVLDDKRLLIVLDNARDSAQVRPLIPASAHCVLVVTSRHRLTDLVTRNGACRLVVPPLTPAETTELLRRLLDNLGTRLDDTAMDSLVEITGGLPQAVRTVAELAATTGIPRPAELLQAGEDESATIGASLMWSYQALPDDAARLFRFLGLHPAADFGEHVAAALSATPHHEAATHSLAALVGHHLVEPVAGRYRLHPLVRAFTADLLATTDPAEAQDAATRRMLDWYQHTLDSAEAILPFTSPSSEQTMFQNPREALAWLETERINLAMAVELAAGRGWPHAWTLLKSLRPFITREEPPSDWVKVHTVTLAAARHANDWEGEAVTLVGLALAHRRTGADDTELECLHAALQVYRTINDRRGEAEALNLIAEHHEHHGALRAALEFANQALAIHTQIDEPKLRGSAHYQVGVVHAHHNEWNEAQHHLDKATTIYLANGDRTGLLRTLTQLGEIAHQRGHNESAFDLFTEAVKLTEGNGAEPQHALPALVHLSELCCTTNQHNLARRYALEAVGLSHPNHDIRHTVRALVSLVRALHALGQLTEATREARKIVELVADIDDPIRTEAIQQLELLKLP